MLSTSVPIPANIDPNASVGLWFPAWQNVGEERAGIYGTQGAMILFDANWEPPGGNGGGGGGGGQQAPLTLANPTVPVRGGDALLELLCRQAAQCTGQAQLQNQEMVPARLRALARAKRPITYASVKFKVPAGRKGTVRGAPRRRRQATPRPSPQGQGLAERQPQGLSHDRALGQGHPEEVIRRRDRDPQ